MNMTNLLTLYKHSGDLNYEQFLARMSTEGKLDSNKIFQEKRRQDEEFRQALARVNNLGKPKKE